MSQLRSELSADVRTVLVLLWVPAVVYAFFYVDGIGGLSVLAELGLFACLLVAGVVPVVLGLLHPPTAENLRTHLALVFHLGSLPLDLAAVRRTARHWRQDLRENGVPRAALAVIEELMGVDPHSVLLPGSFDGLRSAGGTGKPVPSEASRQLERKLAALQGGTIAVSGPRGVGKTTLLQGAVRANDFAITIRVPAAYTPYDLVLSTFVRLCEGFLLRETGEVPQLTRLSGLVRTRDAARRTLRGLRRTLFFGVPAGALVLLGSAAAVKALWDRHDHVVRSGLATAGDWTLQHAEAVWRGRSVGAGLVVTLAGLLIWRLGRSARWRRRVRRAPVLLLRVTGWALAVGSVVSLAADPDVRRLFGEVLTLSGAGFGNLFLVLLCLGLSAFALGRAYVALGVVHVGGWKWVGGAFGVAACVLFLRSADVRAILFESENPTRLACFIAGSLLMKAGRWRIRQPESELVTSCRNHLYQLRTAQSTSTTATLGFAGTAAVGSAHTSALASVPPNFPQLVEDLRERLSEIARHVHRRHGRTLVCIDELDRLATDQQALLFLSEVKAILGVPRVHYLISVAEDVGAAFVRRGLPERDATDSSLDDILHVQAWSLAQSTTLMDERASDLPAPYVVLAHALAGGVPRDLIRYGRRMLEMHEEISSTREARAVELTEISRRLIVEELNDTLAGFRTLLAKQRWDHENAGWLSTYRTVMDHLRYADPASTHELLVALEYLASSGSTSPTASPATPPETAAQLIAEASAYTYFGLTLLQIFHPDDFEGRRLRASTTPAGDLQFLAEARLELSVSPFSARPMIDAARAAWSLSPPRGSRPPLGIPSARPRPS
ncbi:P-loop NTPase fold protein [Streptomyces sp. TLI_105]|uniref:P-loop NTPase fold protein n=1 Tax=Streptomyces sp. TLI_105 TaxID=1881019 RepID=UPI0015A5818A|nr:P-loop NTPase fold protein [Streptomyces sp. TLI_105]